MLNFDSLPDCCWKYLQGVNNKECRLDDFKLKCLKTFRTVKGGVNQGRWFPPNKVTGAVLFCGAYGGGAMAIHGNAVDEETVLRNVEKICRWVDDEELGHIIEIPAFKNALHTSNIMPRLWVIDQPSFKRALVRWNEERGMMKKLKNAIVGGGLW